GRGQTVELGPKGTTVSRKRVFRSTKNQLIVVMLILVISTGVIATAVSTFHAKADLERQISFTMDAVARDTVDQLQVIFIAGTDNANQLALNPKVIDILETDKRTGIDQQKRLAMVPELDSVVKKTSDMITDIRIVNREGEVVAANHLSVIGKNERTNPLFSRGLENTTIGDPFRNDGDMPFISYAAPVIGSGNGISCRCPGIY
ncbi:MAG: hypothetical protein L7F78_26505, partial [Syntrophales bacterium LBB04]|nr:hypothetical protein [Syntrophales bacterium LBB04]